MAFAEKGSTETEYPSVESAWYPKNDNSFSGGCQLSNSKRGELR